MALAELCQKRDQGAYCGEQHDRSHHQANNRPGTSQSRNSIEDSDKIWGQVRLGRIGEITRPVFLAKSQGYCLARIKQEIAIRGGFCLRLRRTELVDVLDCGRGKLSTALN